MLMLEKITRPTLMVNKATTLNNISRMLEKNEQQPERFFDPISKHISQALSDSGFVHLAFTKSRYHLFQWHSILHYMAGKMSRLLSR
jgi:hypothetical protein